jgi:hypothetical protein
VLNYTVKPMTDGPVQLRPGDSNIAGSFSTDYVGNHRWPDGTYTPGSITKLPAPRRGLPVPLPELHEIREKIFQDHVNYQMGLSHFPNMPPSRLPSRRPAAKPNSQSFDDETLSSDPVRRLVPPCSAKCPGGQRNAAAGSSMDERPL